MHYFYGHYYAAQAMWTAGGEVLGRVVPGHPRRTAAANRGRGDGSWADQTVRSHYGTAMACIILQIPNNYLPILQK